MGLRYANTVICALRYGGGNKGCIASKLAVCSGGGKYDVNWIGVGGDGVERRARLDSAAKDDDDESVDKVRCRSWLDLLN